MSVEAAPAPVEAAPAPVAEGAEVTTPTPSVATAKPSSKRERLLATLPKEQRDALTAHRAGETAKPVEKPTSEAAAEKTTKPVVSTATDDQTVNFGEEPTTTTTVEATDTTTTETELTPEQLKALGDDVRKKLAERDKEHIKLRKREQENERKIAETEARAAAAEKARDEALTKLNDSQSRGGLVNNAFAEPDWDAKGVTQWSTAGQEILKQFNKISIAHAAQEEIPSELLEYKLPDGRKMKLDMASYEAAQGWVKDAAAWFEHDAQVTKAKDKAKPVVDKHAKLEGYAAARQSYADDPHVSTRMEELIAKAAFYDVLETRKGKVLFGAADAANNASTSKAAEVQGRAPTPTPTPPRETAASTPRLAPADAAGNAERSALKERAMKSGDPDDIRAALLAVRSRG